MKSLTECLLVGVGGFFGAIARFGVARVSASWFGITFPWGTFLINISGSFLLGLIATLASERLLPYSEQVRLAVAIGFLGAYTTFSTFEFETHALAENNQWPYALANVLASVLVGFMAVRLGILLARRAL